MKGIVDHLINNKTLQFGIQPLKGGNQKIVGHRPGRLAQNLALGALLAAAAGGKKLADADCVQQALLDQEAP